MEAKIAHKARHEHHAEQEAYHAGQQALHAEQKGVHEAEHRKAIERYETFKAASASIGKMLVDMDIKPAAPDALGTIGKFSRGARPLIFGTELSRSASEAIKNPNVVQEKFRKAQAKIQDATTDEARQKAVDAFEKLVKTIQRSIGTYGAVNVRTEGERVVIAYKIETVTRKDKMWDIYKLEPEDGVLKFKSKHEEDH